MGEELSLEDQPWSELLCYIAIGLSVRRRYVNSMLGASVGGRIVVGEEVLEDLCCFCTKFWFSVVRKMNSNQGKCDEQLLQ